MTTQFKFFTIPANDTEDSEAELNAFLRSHRVLNVHRQFHEHSGSAWWRLAVEYMMASEPESPRQSGRSKATRVDYKEVLSPEDFAVFVRLRDWRKDAALAEGVPVYTIFTNEQLAAMVRKKIGSKKDLGELDGVGEARIQKYGDSVMEILKTVPEEKETPAP